MIQLDDVIMVEFPYTDAARSKVRPAVVVQNDRDNQRLRKTIVAMITGNLRRRVDPSHVFIDPAADSSSGLRYPSLVSCNNLLMAEQTDIRQTLGHLSDVLKQQLNASLKAALECGDASPLWMFLWLAPKSIRPRLWSAGRHPRFGFYDRPAPGGRPCSQHAAHPNIQSGDASPHSKGPATFSNGLARLAYNRKTLVTRFSPFLPFRGADV